MKNGSVVRNPIRVLAHHQDQMEEQARLIMSDIQFAEHGFGKEMEAEQQKYIEDVMTGIKAFGRNPDQECRNWEQLWCEIKDARTNYSMVFLHKD